MNTDDYAQRLKTTGRNDPCPCGSGRKYKACHLAGDEAARHAELAKAAEERQSALDAEAAAEAAEDGEKDSKGSARKGGQRRDEHQHIGRAAAGKDRHTNLPRRGAI